jgi:hypothetical protein
VQDAGFYPIQLPGGSKLRPYQKWDCRWQSNGYVYPSTPKPDLFNPCCLLGAGWDKIDPASDLTITASSTFRPLLPSASQTKIILLKKHNRQYVCPYCKSLCFLYFGLPFDFAQDAGFDEIDPAGDLIITVYEYDFRTTDGHGSHPLVKTTRLRVSCKVLMDNSDYSTTMLSGDFKKGSHDVIELHKDTICGAELWFHALHNNLIDDSYLIGREEIYNAIAFSIFHPP